VLPLALLYLPLTPPQIAGDKPSTRRVARGYTLSKPKASYPPPTSLAGLGMREMTDEEVAEVYERRLLDMTKSGEKWFTFEHAGVWREITKQFLGAVRSHGGSPRTKPHV
jgi:hypothetical protein